MKHIGVDLYQKFSQVFHFDKRKLYRFIISALYLIFLQVNPIYSTIGIMGALDEEVNLLKETMEMKKVISVANKTFYYGILEGKEVVLVKSGVGKVNSAFTAQLLIDKYEVDKLIFTGVAGGVNPDLNVGDIVIGSRVAQHDFGKLTPEGFTFFDSIYFFRADTFLIRIAEESALTTRFVPILLGEADTLSKKPSIRVGTIVTGDQFIASPSKREWLLHTFNADCVEMEGASVAQVCGANRVPFVIIRCVSDLAGKAATVDLEKFCKYAAQNSIAIVKKMLHELD